jgi:hypothetical protein
MPSLRAISGKRTSRARAHTRIRKRGVNQIVRKTAIVVAAIFPILFVLDLPSLMWAKASISPLCELAWEAGEAEPVGEADAAESA